MKNLVLISALIVFCINLNAQTTKATNKETTKETKSHEAGLRFTTLNFNGKNDFNLVYKQQKRNSETKYKRYRLTFANISTGNLETNPGLPSFSFGAAVGRENRKKLNDKLKFVSGWELAYNVNLNRATERAYINSSIGCVLGLQYEISNSFCMNIEAIPSIYNQTTVCNGISSSFNFNWTPKAALSVMYKF